MERKNSKNEQTEQIKITEVPVGSYITHRNGKAFLCMPNDIELKRRWVSQRYKEFNDDSNVDYTTNAHTTIVHPTAQAFKSNKRIGIAYCHRDDVNRYNLITGIAIAYARYKGMPIPDYVIK